MNRAVFLDRDGVINREQHYVYRVEDFKFNPGIFESLRIIQEKNYRIIVITNQSGIAKKVYSHQDVNKVHRHMLGKFRREGITITDVFYCPHHDETGNCLCRKPKSLLVEKALAKYVINVRESFFIGDKKRDIEAGERAGVKGILINPGESILKIAQAL